MSEITREQLEKRAEQRARLEEFKASPMASTPEGRALISKIEESIVIRPSKITEPKPESQVKAESPKPVEEQAEKKPVKLPSLNRFAAGEISRYKIPSNIISEMFKTDMELGIEPGSTMAQIYVESGFNPRAVSKVGAKGLAQVMPRTLKAIEARVGRKLNPFKMKDAIIINREVMKENLEMFKDWGSALIAYNAGWNRARWGKTEENAQYFGKVKEAMTKLFDMSDSDMDTSVKTNKLM
jgi:soluble lytic murein transglycosylase-like protein